MKKTLHSCAAVVLAFCNLYLLHLPAHAQVAGSSTYNIVPIVEVAEGWSVKRSVLEKSLYNDMNQRIGKVHDLIIAPDKNVTYLIVSAGGFIGMGKHDVAIPVGQVIEKDGKIVMPGATKDTIKAMPRFQYAFNATRRDEFVARAEQEISRIRTRIAEIEKNSATSDIEAQARINQQIASSKQQLIEVEKTVAQLNQAKNAMWQIFTTNVKKAIERVQRSLDDIVVK